MSFCGPIDVKGKIRITFFLFIITDDNCQYWKKLENMTLFSPNYPKFHNSDGVACEWLISAPEGFIIALEFNDFLVSKKLDFVKKFVITLCNICYFTY